MTSISLSPAHCTNAQHSPRKHTRHILPHERVIPRLPVLLRSARRIQQRRQLLAKERIRVVQHLLILYRRGQAKVRHVQRLVQRVDLDEARVHGERRCVDVSWRAELRGDGLRLAGEEEDEVV